MNIKVRGNLIAARHILLLLVACNVLLYLTGCSTKTSGESESIIIFKDVSVIDAVEGIRDAQSVVVKGNRIVEVAPVEKINAYTDATVIELSGKYLIPGLWDAHVHLSNTRALRPAMFPLMIVNGITYVRDTGATLEYIIPLREKAEKVAISNGMAPRVFMTGPHIDGSQLSWNSSVSAVSVREAGLIIDSLVNAGVDELKVYDLLSPDICLEVLSIADSLGYRVSSHIPLSMDVIEASNAGLASMEHMQNLEMSCSSDWDLLLEERTQMIAKGSEKSGRELRGDIYQAQRLRAIQTQDDERCSMVLGTLAENNTLQVPTLVITAREEHKIFASDDYRKTFRYLPEPVRSDWEKNAIRDAEQAPSEEELAYAQWAYDMIPKLVEAGVGIMAGTDMPLALLTPGFSLHEELALLVRAGLTPMQALESATLQPAKYYGVDNIQGSIGQGMMADLVILDANPLEDITNTRRIRAVMRNGHLLMRDDLDEILAQLENSR